MSAFKDATGREWLLAINVKSLREVRDRCGVRADRLLDDRCAPLAELLGDPIKFGEVLWVLCERQAADRKVEPEQFAEAIWGDCVEHAADAFLGSLADFYPSRQRKAIQALAAKMREVRKLAEEKADEKLKELEAVSPESLSPPSGSPESPASIPTP